MCNGAFTIAFTTENYFHLDYNNIDLGDSLWLERLSGITKGTITEYKLLCKQENQLNLSSLGFSTLEYTKNKLNA